MNRFETMLAAAILSISPWVNAVEYVLDRTAGYVEEVVNKPVFDTENAWKKNGYLLMNMMVLIIIIFPKFKILELFKIYQIQII